MEYTVTNIKYDTDGEDIDLPKELKIDVPNDLTERDEIEEYINDEISNKTGFCHLGFATTPEIKDIVHGSDCCGQPMVLSDNGLVFECLKCGAWSYSSS